MRALRILGPPLLLVWLFTGGVAMQRVHRFDAVESSHLSDSDQLHLWLGGDISIVDVPFLFSRYSEQGRYRLKLAYHDGDEQAPCSELRVRSVKLEWDGGRLVELVDSTGPLILRVLPETYWNSTDRGVVSHTSHGAEHTFDPPLEIPFEEGKLIRCEIDLERIGGARPARRTLVWTLRGEAMDFVRTYWAHIAGC